MAAPVSVSVAKNAATTKLLAKVLPVVAEFVPGLVHMSLFLFFLGLGDSLLNVNTTIGITTIIPIAVCSLLYIFCMFAPVLYPQSPFRNSLSSLIWYLMQKMHLRRYLDRAFGSVHKPVSRNKFEGQMQLAMEENDGRQCRDARAIQWLVQTLTEDIEVESFVLAIPGSFSTEWGIEVWRKVSDVKQYGEANPSSIIPVVEFQIDAELQVPVSSPFNCLMVRHTHSTNSELSLIGSSRSHCGPGERHDEGRCEEHGCDGGP
jgi:hypothetical protein